ncbi:ribosomal large subunit pseudouridine synthase B [Spiroplasma sabaudiense Ar-1343]|uniref:Ribosomal large subunit pseudouridine synthase B n=1 Tax=Spiroplasma sabaudiense Ar-1343 TaxID=1276257 RepID=W6A926_9MOLU|nr:pseudouridine synthase [Spiroplasma sabaudiense]AHI53648.1 ribosomal large subunit pseudouridine synthase B [Spiroplasma sabaudiense Ar-1343]
MAQERLQKIIANRGYASRRKAEELIEAGKVRVNGNVVTELGTKFETDVEIIISGKELLTGGEKVYLLFYKPRLVLTTMKDPKNRPTVADYFNDFPERVYPVGRLDYDVSGLLIMTNDGDFANFVMHPRYEFTKTYQALCKGKVSKFQIKQLTRGVVIDDDYKTKAISSRLVKFDEEKDVSIVELKIAEGRKHHVKKMLIAADIFLTKLKRTKIEFLEIDDLTPGHYRPLKPHEVKQFYGIFTAVRRKNDNDSLKKNNF